MSSSVKCFAYIVLGYLIYVPIVMIVIENIFLYLISLFIFMRIWNKYVFSCCYAEIDEKGE